MDQATAGTICADVIFFLAGLWVAVGNKNDNEGWPTIMLGIVAFIAAVALFDKATLMPPKAR